MEDAAVFKGIKVLAIARQVAAPFATYQLALHGADVLTIENPKEPDSMRVSAGAGDGTGLPAAAMSHAFMAHAANKRSMTLNLAAPEGQDIFRRLAASADVLVENLKTGDMARYGLDYSRLSALNPRLIFCSITGYGQNGPGSRRSAIDGAVQATSGLMSMTGTPETGPLRAGFLTVDYATGYAAALGITIALYHRTMTGKGQFIDTAMLDTALTIASNDVCEAGTTGKYLKLRGNGDGRYISTVFRCKEGLLMVAASTERRRALFWKAIGREDIPRDPRFANAEAVRRHGSEMTAEIEKTLASRPAIEWEEIISEVGVAATAVRSLNEALVDPQLIHREFIHQFPFDETLGYPVKVPKAAYQLSDSPARIYAFPPRIGQHTDEVLAQLGFTETAISRLRDERVV